MAVLFFHTQIINYNYLYAINAWRLIVPQLLCFDWSMGCVPIINTYSDPHVYTLHCCPVDCASRASCVLFMWEEFANKTVRFF